MGAEPVATGSRALGLMGAPPSPAGHPPGFPSILQGPTQLPFALNFLRGTSVVCNQRITDQIREKHYFQISIIKHPRELSKYLL